MSEREFYLVLATVYLVGSSVPTVVVDVFEALDTHEAMNMAHNTFLQAGDHAVVYGDCGFLPEMVASVTPEVLGVVDISHPANAKWADSIAVAQHHEEQIAEQIRRIETGTREPREAR